MNDSDRLCETEWLHQVLAVLMRFRSRRADLDALRASLAKLAWSDLAPKACTFTQPGDRFRRHPLASVEAIGCSALLMYWPPGHATLPHDHGGFWGIEIVLDGSLDIEEFVLGGTRDAPALSRLRALRLGAGDSAMFTQGDYVHRCRNLSNVAPTLTLHVYGGDLARYSAFDSDASGALRALEQIPSCDRRLS